MELEFFPYMRSRKVLYRTKVFADLSFPYIQCIEKGFLGLFQILRHFSHTFLFLFSEFYVIQKPNTRHNCEVKGKLHTMFKS